MATETRVRWNPAEKALLVAEAKRAMNGRPMRYMDALSAAQEKLPAGRRRNVPGAWDVPWFVEGLGSTGAAAHASALANGTLTRAKRVAGVSDVSGLREQLVSFFTDVLAEALTRAERQVGAAGRSIAAVPGRRASKARAGKAGSAASKARSRRKAKP